MMKFLKKHLTSIILTVMLMGGVGLLAYPTIADWWNSMNAARLTSSYVQSVESLDSSDLKEMVEEAKVYNEELIHDPGRLFPTDSQHTRYLNELDLGESGVMGTINIPSARIQLPIYHGTDDRVLAVGAGHLEGTSLPIGGIGTHAVITGHRGLPSARLFTDLDRVVEGDYMIVSVLNQKATYQVDKIRIVDPDEISGLKIEPDQDLLTLVTCTPYGVNTQRMLITGHRVENLQDWETTAEAGLVNSNLVALFIACAILVVLFITLMIRGRKPKEGHDE